MTTKKVKNQIEVMLVVDNREQDLNYLKTFKIDERVNADGIKIIGYEMETCKPNLCKISTGDITFKWRIKDSNSGWIYSKFCTEIKKSTDMFSSLYTKANRDRLYAEVDRVKEYGLDFYFLSTDDLTTLNTKINKIPKFRKSKISNPTHTFFGHLIKFNDYLKSNGYNQIFCCGTDISYTLRRLIKKHIADYKLQYGE